MASDITKWADHAYVLSKQANTLLAALHSVKKTLDQEAAPSNDILTKGGSPDLVVTFRGTIIKPEAPARPPLQRLLIFLDPQVANLQNKLKKFPDFGDIKEKDLTIFQNQSGEILQDLKQYYDVFGAIAEYIDLATPVLLGVETHTELVMTFFELMANIAKLLLLASTISPLKKAYQTTTGEASSPNWNSIVQFFKIHEKPIATMQNLLAPILPTFNNILQGLTPMVNAKISDVQSLGLWNILEGSGNSNTQICRYSGQSLSEIMLLGFLVNPNAELADAVKNVLGVRNSVNLVRDEGYSLYYEIEQVSKDNVKVPKLKSLKQDLVSASGQIANYHHTLRNYLLVQLRTILAAFKSKIGFKQFPVIIDALSTCKEEVYFYFDNYDLDALGSPLKGKQQKTFDHTIAELIWLHKSVWTAIIQGKRELQQYLVSEIELIYATISDFLRANFESLSSDLNEPELEIIKQIMETCRSPLQESDFHGLRMNWLRFQAFLAFNGKALKTKMDIIKEQMEKFYQISCWVDDFSLYVAEHSSWKCLYYKQNALHEHMKEIYEIGGDAVKYSVAYGLIATDFNENIPASWTYDGPHVQSHTMCYATEFFSVYGQFAASIAHDLANRVNQYLAAPAPEQGTMTRKTMKKSRLNEPSNKENDPKLLQVIEEDRALLLNLMDVFQYGGIPIYDVVFHPFEFFLDSLCTKFRMFLNQGVYLNDILVTKENWGVGGVDIMSFDIKRPSALLKEIKNYMNGMSYLCRITGVNVKNILRDVWVDQIDHEKYLLVNIRAKRFASGMQNEMVFELNNKPQRNKGLAVQQNSIQPFLITIVQWYSEFIASKAASGAAVFSPLHESFCNIAPSSIQAENYTGADEMKALFDLIGLEGMQFFEEKLVRMATVQASALQDIIGHNKDLLAQINPLDGRALKDQHKKFLYMTNFISEATALGFILQFRDLLSKAAKSNFEDRIPYVTRLVENLLHEPGINSEELKAVHVLANQMGNKSCQDGMLKWGLSALTSEAEVSELWSWMPNAFGLAVLSLVNSEKSVYNSSFDCLENNGHSILYAFGTLTESINALRKKSKSETLDQYRKFLHLASTIVFSEWEQENEKQYGAKSTPSIVITLHKFAKSVKSLSENQVHVYLPSALLMSCIQKIEHNTYQRGISGGISRDDDLAL
ncbi:Nck-associated protein 1 [Terramyces sp. JEL0728]|nr:Nck-associated protein 1 [Terramyces sp. JEL0728]